jgi:hypothetical protein
VAGSERSRLVQNAHEPLLWLDDVCTDLTYIGLSKRGYKPDEEAEALCPELSKKGCPDPFSSSGLPAASTMSSHRPPFMHWHDESPDGRRAQGLSPSRFVDGSANLAMCLTRRRVRARLCVQRPGLKWSLSSRWFTALTFVTKCTEVDPR